jgi:hypothetical protein
MMNRLPKDTVRDEIREEDLFKPGHHRRCWLSQKLLEKRSCIRRLKAREILAMPLVIRTPMALETDCRDFTNRASTPLTSVGNDAASPAAIRSASSTRIKIYIDH